MKAGIYEFVKETSNTEGTVATITLTSIAGYARFSDVAVAGSAVYYTILNGLNREVGLGVVQANNTLDRDTPLTTLEAGVYTDEAVSRISLIGESQVAITPSAETLHSLETDMSAKAIFLIGA